MLGKPHTKEQYSAKQLQNYIKEVTHFSGFVCSRIYFTVWLLFILYLHFVFKKTLCLKYEFSMIQAFSMTEDEHKTLSEKVQSMLVRI